MKKNLIINDKVFRVGGKPFQITLRLWTPAEITTEMWLDASDESTITESGGLVSSLADKSANGYDANQTFVSARPTTGTRMLNGLNLIDFDGVSQYFKFDTGPANDGDAICISVIDFDGNTQRQRGMTFQDIVATRWSMEFTNGNNFEYNQDDGSFEGPNLDFAPTTGAKLFEGYRDGSLTYVGINGEFGVTPEASSSGPLNEWRFGAYRSGGQADPNIQYFLDAALGEHIIVKQYSLSLLQKIEGYLAWKWGLTSNLPVDHPYKAEAPTV